MHRCMRARAAAPEAARRRRSHGRARETTQVRWVCETTDAIIAEKVAADAATASARAAGGVTLVNPFAVRPRVCVCAAKQGRKRTGRTPRCRCTGVCGRQCGLPTPARRTHAAVCGVCKGRACIAQERPLLRCQSLPIRQHAIVAPRNRTRHGIPRGTFALAARRVVDARVHALLDAQEVRLGRPRSGTAAALSPLIPRATTQPPSYASARIPPPAHLPARILRLTQLRAPRPVEPSARTRERTAAVGARGCVHARARRCCVVALARRVTSRATVPSAPMDAAGRVPRRVA